MVAINAKTLFLVALGGALSTQVACEPTAAGQEQAVHHHRHRVQEQQTAQPEGVSHRLRPHSKVLAKHAHPVQERDIEYDLMERDFDGEDLERRLLFGAIARIGMTVGKKIVGKVAKHAAGNAASNNNNNHKRSIDYEDVFEELYRRELADLIDELD
jgi:hypothetical protein